MIKRIYTIQDLLQPGKVFVLYGPRRVGKTTLIKTFLDETRLKYRFDVGDDIRVAELLGSRDLDRILRYVEGLELYVIDEAQMIPEVGTGLKILVDQRPDLKVIATGSSSFELSQHIGEPLVGRQRIRTMYPLSQGELLTEYLNRAQLIEHLPEFLIYGSYPGVYTAQTREEKIEYLNELVGSYLLRDILTLEQVKSSAVLVNLLKMLAFQIGNLVSVNELANGLDVNARTVARYLDLLEKSFVICSLGGFSRNLRSEINQKKKYYFWDNGIRNAVISQFNTLDLRDDIGALWENFVFIERMKNLAYRNNYGNIYFWRTHQGQEIDFVEEKDGKLRGYELKWSNTAAPRVPQDWAKAYPIATFEIINRDNYLEYVIDEKTSQHIRDDHFYENGVREDGTGGVPPVNEAA